MTELEHLRELAKQYAEFALSDTFKETKEMYRRHNALNIVRPPVLVFEEPWGEFADNEELKPVCSDEKLRSYEMQLRQELFQLRHFRGNYIVHDYWRSGVVLHDSGNGLAVEEDIKTVKTGTHIVSHIYKDTIPDAETFLKKVRTPVITYDREQTERNLADAEDIFGGILRVKKAGVSLYLASWDQIPRFHGVENVLTDLYDEPEYAHLLIDRFTENHIAVMKQYEALNVLDTDPMYLHCTPAPTFELPVKDMDRDDITLKDVWARGMAQIFAVVSPKMHDEFDFQYMQKLFDMCGLSYYGCCEPLHQKVDDLRRRFKNLRRISITAWADPDAAAERIGKDFVLSYKPNPAFVAGKSFDSEPVKAEIKRVLEACKRNSTPCEFILKDISTTSNNYTNLTKWVETVNSVIDSYY